MLRLIALIGGLTLAMGLSASAGVGAGNQTTTINYATSFGSFGRDAYVYVAIERGFFRDAGFEVRVTNGSGSVDNIRLVAAGRLDYAPVDIAALITTKANEGIPVKVTSVVHQITPSAIFTLEETGIQTPKQLEGKTLADSPASTVRVLFPIYARKAGVDPSRVTWRDAAPPALPALLASKQVDGIGQFTLGRPLLRASAGGRELRALRYAPVLPNMLGIGIIASEDKIRTNAAEVRRFNQALLRGLNWSLENPGQAGWILKKYNPLADPVVAGNELRIMRSYSRNKLTRTKGNGTGYIDIGKINSTISIVRNGFRITKPVPATDIYTNVAVPARRTGK